MTLGVVALARPTFDVDFAELTASRAFSVLDAAAPGWQGRRVLLFDAATTAAAIDELADIGISALLVLQVTFTDATMTKVLTDAVEVPLAFWAFPEARTGGRLRLNSLCGLNLAAYALRRRGLDFAYLYREPSTDAIADVRRVVVGPQTPGSKPAVDAAPLSAAAYASADRVVAAMRNATMAVIGKHPDGFEPSEFDADVVRGITGVTIKRLELNELFTAALEAPAAAVTAARARAEESLGDLSRLDQAALERSLRLFCALDRLATDQGWDGFATRCWPECFTEFGAAACAPQAMMTGQGIPGGCEADAYGTLTSLVLQTLAGEPAFVADLVDVDVTDDTAVFWHCGLAPLTMAHSVSEPSGTIHSNRKKPLLHEFPLKPGRVTVARLSRSKGVHGLVVGGGHMLRVPRPFSGTAGVIRFDAAVDEVLDTIMREGLEHHYGIVYGDHRAELRALGERWGLPVVELT